MFDTGNEQLDQATQALFDASMRGDVSGVIGAMAYVKAAVADLPIDASTKDAAIKTMEAMAEDVIQEATKRQRGEP